MTEKEIDQVGTQHMGNNWHVINAELLDASWSSVVVYPNVLSDKMSNMQVLGSHYYTSEREREKEEEHLAL